MHVIALLMAGVVLLVVSWPLALLLLLLMPIVWLIRLPFRVVGACVDGLLVLVKARAVVTNRQPEVGRKNPSFLL